jgi:hypothetical protein
LFYTTSGFVTLVLVVIYAQKKRTLFSQAGELRAMAFRGMEKARQRK